MTMHSSHDFWLVALSIAVAIFASYTALALAGRVTVTAGAARRAWLLGGSIAMGTGIWSMHFVAMRAFRLPVPISYDVPVVLLSLLAAIAVSAFALVVASRRSVGWRLLGGAGALMGAGIATMHYTGMAALRLPARLAYDARLVTFSVFIAMSAATVALWIFRRLRDDGRQVRSLRAGAAVLLGFAIAGLHYTAMLAARFDPLPAVARPPQGFLVANGDLAFGVVAGTFLILIVTLVGAVTDHWVRVRLAGAEALRESEERYRSVVSEVREVIFRTDAAGRWTFLNPAWTGITGFPQEECLGTPSLDYVHPEDRRAELDAFRALCEGNENAFRHEVRYRTADGGMRWLEVHAQVTRDPRGALLGTAGTLRDVTERRKAEEALRAAEERLVYQALHDQLTGLANRALFRDRVEQAIARAARGDWVAVLFLDLDNFKAVNDSLGHGEGDRLLQVVATRLLKATRGYDTVARLGGDEFAILIEGQSQPDDVLVVVARIAEAMRRPIPLHGREVLIGASVGVANVDSSQDVDEVLRNADVAMYSAKAAGKGGHRVFEPSMHAAVLERLELEGGLRHALKQGEFALVYQPIVELETGRPIAVEALVRWHHPTRGLLHPAVFIPVAEESGLIVPLGRWVLNEACRQGRRWQLDFGGRHSLAVSVNISGRQLLEPDFPDQVAAVLQESGLRPELLTLEMTESVLIHDTQATCETMHALKDLGVQIAIDDFGTGYSSLGYLQRFPIDVLKIDKAFIDGVVRNDSDTALARTIVTLARMLDLRTVAEGVEHAEQRAQLVSLGCGHGQGYLFARPLVSAEIDDLLRDASRATTESLPPDLSMAAS